jgi:hypothetical protein
VPAAPVPCWACHSLVVPNTPLQAQHSRVAVQPQEAMHLGYHANHCENATECQ